MKSLTMFAVLAMLSNACFASASEESCEVMRKVDGRLVSVAVPCAQIEHEESCYEEKTDAKGWTTSTAVPCATGKRKTVEQRQRDEDVVKKRKCGKDFMALRVGMALNRFEECNEALSYVTDTVGKGGTVETYRSTFYFIHAQNGRVVSYTRRTH